MTTNVPAFPHDHHRKLSQREHVLLKPGMYVGSAKPTPRSEWILDLEKGRMVKAHVETPPAVERVFLEVLSNAADAHYKARQAGLIPGEIVVNMNENTVEVINGGFGIPVKVDEKEKVYVPEMIFGQMLTSSNFEENQVRMWCGTNGIGVKTTNIFSKRFAVEVADPEARLHYRQEWTDNMSVVQPAVITSYKETYAYVRVTYDLDFARFGCAGYGPAVMSLFAKHAADMAFTTSNEVVFNGHALSFGGVTDYARLYFEPAVVDRGMVFERKEEEYTLEAVALDTPDNAETVSFVNGLITRKGGVHVDAVMKLISDKVLEKFKGDSKTRLNLSNVRPHVSLIVSYRAQNPEFDSQTKEYLSHPRPARLKLGKEGKILLRWSLLDRLSAELTAKDFKKLSSTDGKKKQHIGPTPGVQANFAGTKRSHECTLLLVEGRSAEGYASMAIDNIEGGHDFVGVFPLKGKPLNVTNAGVTRILGNDEISRLKKVLGLREGVGANGCDYAQEKEYLTLRYGRIVIMADADDDGKHITALVVNLFYTFYRGLLQRGCVFFFRSPIIRCARGAQKLSFFTETEYNNWASSEPTAHLWKAKYFKGLGSSNRDDVADDFADPHYVECFYDDATPETLRLAFDAKLADERKDWMLRWKPFFGSEELIRQPISQFVNRELVLYARRTIERAIPSLLDGQKDSQRKVLEGARWHWGTKDGLWRLSGDPRPAKVVDFAAEVSTRTKYRHGPDSMVGAIIGMAQDFAGSQNLPFFVDDGSFGTRNLGGADHASGRYLSTYPQAWLPFVFRNEDVPVLRLNADEGENIEPHRFLPVVPLAVINGARGVAMGWKTFIPCHSPKSVIGWLRARIDARPLPKLLPWYRGFSGEITVGRVGTRVTPRPVRDDLGEGHAAADIPDTSDMEGGCGIADGEKEKALGVPALDDDEVDVQDGEPSMVTKGKFTVEIVDGKRRRRKGETTKVVVSELPLGRWSQPYYQMLEKLAESDAIDFSNHCGTSTVHFEIVGLEDPTIKSLKLQKTYGLSNMILLDEDGVPQRYATVDAIMEAFYCARLPWYEKRKAHRLADFDGMLEKTSSKVAFIEAVNSGELVIKDRTSAEIEEQMTKMRLPFELFGRVTVGSLSKDKLGELKREMKELADARAVYARKTAGGLWLEDLNDFEAAYDAWLVDIQRREKRREKRRDGGKRRAAKHQPTSGRKE